MLTNPRDDFRTRMARRIGYAIGQYPWVFIGTTIVLLLPVLSFFFLRPIIFDTDVRRGFAHRHGRSTLEFKAFGNFYNVSMEDIELMVVLVEAKDGGKTPLLITEELLEEVTRLDDYVSTLTIDTSDGRRVSMKDVQSIRGQVNFLLEAFKFGYSMNSLAHMASGSFDPDVVLDYPVSHIYSHDVNIGSHFFRVQEFGDNETHLTSMKSAEVIALWYMITTKPSLNISQSVLEELELALFETSLQNNFSTLFNFNMYGDQVANAEMSRGSRQTVRLISVGMVLMLVFMVVVMWDLPHRCKLVLIPVAVACPLLASAATFAILGWYGYAFNSIMSICPFLILGIGVDDAFLLVHSWRRLQNTLPTPGQHMAVVVGEVGPSIFITSITNSLAFGVGIFSSSVQMSSFCICTTLAVALDFVLEFVLFAPCLALVTPDDSGRTPVKPVPSKTFLALPLPEKKVLPEDSFWRHYAKFLAHPMTKVLAVFVIVALHVFSYLGFAQMDATFEPQKTFPADSSLQFAIRSIDKIYAEYAPLSFIVNRPPNVTDAADLAGFMGLVDELEGLPESYGPQRTELWLRGYLKYFRKHANESEPLSYEMVPEYLEDRRMDDKAIVHYHRNAENRVVVDNFFFVVVCYGRRNWHDRAFFIERIRTLIDTYPAYNVSVFDYDSTIFDLIITVKVEMLKAVLITLACMAVVCFIIIPSVTHTLVANLGVVSISWSLLGSLGWWGQDMDPVTMINVLMAIGFSVDFCAHVCFHYYRLRNQQYDAPRDLWPELKIADILSAVGRPTLEAACSTLICMTPLFFVSVYVVICFAKTVICVGLLGVLHGIFIIPALFVFESTCSKPETKPPVLEPDATESCQMIESQP